MRRPFFVALVLFLPWIVAVGCGGGSVATPSPTPTPSKSEAALAGGHKIQVFLESWAVDHGGRYPSGGLVTPAKFAQVMGTSDWPMNPWSGAPVASGTGPGDFTYLPSADRKNALLVVHGQGKHVIQQFSFGQ